jgi:hypothetical protein
VRALVSEHLKKRLRRAAVLLTTVVVRAWPTFRGSTLLRSALLRSTVIWPTLLWAELVTTTLRRREAIAILPRVIALKSLQKSTGGRILRRKPIML